MPASSLLRIGRLLEKSTLSLNFPYPYMIAYICFHVYALFLVNLPPASLPVSSAAARSMLASSTSASSVTASSISPTPLSHHLTPYTLVQLDLPTTAPNLLQRVHTAMRSDHCTDKLVERSHYSLSAQKEISKTASSTPTTPEKRQRMYASQATNRGRPRKLAVIGRTFCHFFAT